MKNSILAVAALCANVMACGHSAHSQGSSSGPDSTFMSVDLGALAATNASLQSESGKEALWTVRVVVNGLEKLKLTTASFTDLGTGLKPLTFKRDDAARLEMTVVSKGGSNLVLATNVDTVAGSDASLKSVWQRECQGVVSPDVKIGDGGVWSDAGSGKGTASILLTICDFSGVTLKPAIEIKPQPEALEKKTVIYHCQIKAPVASVIGSDITSSVDVPCTYGYETAQGEGVPTISILKDYAPDSPLFATHALVMHRFALAAGPSGQPLIETDFGLPPFGSLEACPVQKLDVKYGTPTGIQASRLSFQRTTGASGQALWTPSAAAGMPDLKDIVAYYSDASAETIDLYRICEWIPEAEDTDSGSVIVFKSE